jgi:hypothetical protein
MCFLGCWRTSAYQQARNAQTQSKNLMFFYNPDRRRKRMKKMIRDLDPLVTPKARQFLQQNLPAIGNGSLHIEGTVTQETAKEVVSHIKAAQAKWDQAH